MTPIWLALPFATLACAAGAAIEWLATRRLDRSALGVATYATQGLAVVAALAVHPVIGLCAIAAVFAIAKRWPVAGQAASPKLALVCVAVGATLIVLQPPVPIAWDELVWLARARVGSAGPAALIERSLDPAGGLVPSGYPIGAGLLQSSMACLSDELAALTGGAGALVLFTYSVFALALAQSTIASRAVTTLALAMTPLAWVHLRTGMLDLPVGTLAAAFALALHGAARGDARLVRLVVPVALLLTTLKDEGGMFVVVIAAASVVDRAHRRALAPHVLTSVVAALAALGCWRLRLSLRGTPTEHHALVGFALGALGPLLRELARAASDVESFGGSLAMVLLAALSASGPRARPIERALGLAWIGCLGGAITALLIGPDAVRSFATSGTLWPRLLLELMPLGAVLLGARWQRSLPRDIPSGDRSAGAS